MRIARSVLLAFAGASLWLSLGTLAVLDVSMARVGTLPSAWALAALVLVGAVLGWFGRLALAALWPLTLLAVIWLPWLPLRVPAAFLMWNGPLEILVWLAALSGVAAAAFEGSSALAPIGRWLGQPRRAMVLTLLIGAAAGLLAARQLDTRVPAGDEPHYLIITQSLLLDGDLQIENNHQRGDYLPYFADLRRPDFLRRGVNGQIYSVHAPGLPALVAPAFAIGGYHGVVVFIALLVAGGGALAWHAAWLLTGSAAAAWIGWLAVFFSVPVFFHVFTVYPDGAGAAFAMAAVWLLVRLTMDARPVAPGVLAAVGAALAMLPWLHTRFALVAAGLGLAVALRLIAGAARWRQLAAFLSVPVISAAGWFAFFKIVYGTFSPAAPYGNVVQNRVATLQPGLPGLFFDQQFGLIANAPIFAVAILGLFVLARRRPRLAAELTLVAVPYVLAVASFMMWWGGHSAPARFLMILLLPAVLPVAWLARQLDAVWARVLLIAAALVGCLFTVLRLEVNAGILLYNSRDGYDLLLDWLSPTVNLPLAFPSLHRDIVPMALRDILTWTLVLIVAAAITWALLRRAGRSRGGSWAFGSAMLASAVMTACTLVWARHETLVVTPATSQLAFLQEWDPDWHPLELQLTPTALLTREDVLPRIRLASTFRGPAPGANRPLLYVPQVPAGEYEIVAAGGSTAAGTLEVSVGRSSQLVERFELSNRAAGLTGLVLRLPVLVHSITIRGDDAARSRISNVTLRPRAVVPPAQRLTDSYARRAARYGSARVFFLDDDPFMETPGFWTQGHETTSVVVDVDPGGSDALIVRAGAVETTASFSAGEWGARYDLAPGQQETVELPRPPAPRLFTIGTSAAFRPADIDRTSSDLRMLGVWVEFPR